MWEIWKQGFNAWEQTTAQYMEKVLTNPGVLGPAGQVDPLLGVVLAVVEFGPFVEPFDVGPSLVADGDGLADQTRVVVLELPLEVVRMTCLNAVTTIGPVRGGGRSRRPSRLLRYLGRRLSPSPKLRD